MSNLKGRVCTRAVIDGTMQGIWFTYDEFVKYKEQLVLLGDSLEFTYNDWKVPMIGTVESYEPVLTLRLTQK